MRSNNFVHIHWIFEQKTFSYNGMNQGGISISYIWKQKYVDGD